MCSAAEQLERHSTYSKAEYSMEYYPPSTPHQKEIRRKGHILFYMAIVIGKKVEELAGGGESGRVVQGS